MDQIQKGSQFHVEFVKYKIIPTVDLNTQTQVKVKLQNVGQKDWPETVQMQQVPIKSLKVNEVNNVMIAIPQIERYCADWRICFIEDGIQTWFGPTLSLDIQFRKSESDQGTVKLNFVYEVPNIKTEQAQAQILKPSTNILQQKVIAQESYQNPQYDAVFSDLQIDPYFEPFQHASLKVNIRNSGPQDWPRFVLIKQLDNKDINGFQTIRPLKFNEAATFKIFFLAPSELAKYKQNWRLFYQEQENGQITQFGPSFEVDFEVKSDFQKLQKQKREVINAIHNVFSGKLTTIERYVDQIFQAGKFYSIDDTILELSDIVIKNDKFLE